MIITPLKEPESAVNSVFSAAAAEFSAAAGSRAGL
jgi:hypothetical protein